MSFKSLSDAFPYRVNIPVHIKTRYDLISFLDKQKKMMNWCSENIEHWGYGAESRTFGFSFEKDAVLFALRWS